MLIYSLDSVGKFSYIVKVIDRRSTIIQDRLYLLDEFPIEPLFSYFLTYNYDNGYNVLI